MSLFRLSLNNVSQEAILRVRSERADYSPKRYERAIDMFLSEYPTGETRKNARRPDGYRPHKRTSKKKTKIVEVVPLSSDDSTSESESDAPVDLSDISSDEDEWTESESED